MQKILLLESNWLPQESRLLADVYQRVLPADLMQTQALMADSCQQVLLDFIRHPARQRGPHLIILSAHAQYGDKRECWFRGGDSRFDLNVVLKALRGQLKRSILLLDACFVGQDVQRLQQNCGALGVIGFAGPINWTASSIFNMALLRQWQAAGLWQMQRCSPRRPEKVIQIMQQQVYKVMMQQLQVNFTF
ncbi:hypothetical protein QUF61_03800 [Candidatus Venteria ishoeyi]|uniref:hypothetical protein n=1 Tax=Candidatus Venteria ishoeyi TaxID=1899563 RepID=UPI0025A604FF|nr:hypothetical protein [Candidatus Venteria ishoeyi]MDM8545598.1 hypothetical protein [Candidatus Venteria ishoeyi]